MTSNSTETDFFDNVGGGSGAPSPLLKNPGDLVHGEIVDMYKRDYIPFGKQEPEKREDGTNKQQLVIILQTQHRNWQNVNKVPKVDHNDPNSPEKSPEEDDGKRAVYVPEGKNIQFAIGRAAAAAQAKPAIGGTLGVRVVNLKDTGKGKPLKEHEAVYQAPSAGSTFFNEAPAAPAQTETASPAPAPAPTAQPTQAAPPAPAQQDPWATSAPAPQAQQADPWASSAPVENKPAPF